MAQGRVPRLSDRRQRARIRAFRAADEEVVVALSLRAWAPVYASLEGVLGNELSERLHGDWREHQAGAVRATLAGADRVWIAEADGRAVGFAAATLARQPGLGEIAMVAVDPGAQRRGIGSELTELASGWLRRSGMRVAMVETGGDRGHAPARGLYETVGYTPLPIVRYFKAL